MQIYTRAMFRDAVRWGLGQVPPSATGAGAIGAQPVRNPWPKNGLIDMNLDFAVADMSAASRVAGDARPRMIPIAAQTDAVPYLINLQSLTPALHVTEVRRAAWYDSTGVETARLASTSREALDYQERVSSLYVPPATPQKYWVEGMNLYVWPAPSSDGTLSLLCGQSLWSESQTIDGEIPDLIPTDHYPLLINKAVVLVCNTQPEDQVLQEIAASAEKNIAMQWPRWLSFCAMQDRGRDPRFVAKTGRTGVMLGRR